jgi:hypothetical protein
MRRNRFRGERRQYARGGAASGRNPTYETPPFAGVGTGVDIHGGPVFDPTANVRALNDASVKRIDDMAELYARLQDEKIRRIETEMRALTHEVKIRARHQQDLDALESKRLDAIRAVDQLTAKTEADRQAAAVTTLATQAATTAETLRSAVNTSATNLATQSDRNQTAMTERIAALEKSSYTGQGKQAVADPMMEQLIGEMRNLTAQRAADAGKSAVSDPLLVELMAEVRRNTAKLAGGDGEGRGRHGSQENLKSVLQVGIAAILLMIALATFFLKTSAPPQVVVQPVTVPASTVPR